MKPLPARPYVSRELPVHRSILQYLRLALPDAVTHHSPQNLGVGQGKDRAIARAVALAKDMGMLVGWPDLITVHEGRLLAWEVKADGGTTSEAQKAVGAALQAAGAHWAVVRGIEDVRECLDSWGVGRRA